MKLRRTPLAAIAAAVLSAGVLTAALLTAGTRGGSIKLVTVPHTNGDNQVLIARGSRLLIQAPTECTGSVSLLWYDPGKRAEQWLIRAPRNALGVANAIPFYSRENGNL